MNYKPILVVAGEPNSIFFEIFFKSLKNNHFKSPLILIASKDLLLNHMMLLGFNFKINTLSENFNSHSRLDNKNINIIDIKYDFKKTFDVISNKSNKYITKCFAVALKLLKKKNYFKLINGPVSKKNFLQGKYLGITEYLAKKTKCSNVAMLIYNKNLSVSPLTTHLPLKNVHKNLSKIRITSHVKLITNFYKNNLEQKAKIAITGLNPHCESNFKDSEESTIITPTIKNLKAKNFKVEGPFPADTIFMQKNLKKFNVIIGMYHDQVLTPMKALFGFDAINITLGLPFERISPDHGPNSSMLGKNSSDPKSLIEALKFLDK